MSRSTLPCVICGAALENVTDSSENQPYAGTAFQTYGHYGSTIFDPMDGHFLEINVCDPCLQRLVNENKVLLGRSHKQVVTYDGPEELRGIPQIIGSVPVRYVPVPWRPGLEDEETNDRLVLEPDEIGPEQHPEVKYLPGFLEGR